MAGTSIKDLFVTLGVNADIAQLNKFDAGLNRVRSSMRSVATIALSSTIGLGAIAKVVKDTVNLGDDIEKSVEKFGITSDVLQGIQYAAYQTDIPIEALDMSFRKMAMTLKQMGRTDITTQEAFFQLADRFSQMPDGVLKTATAVKWFGRAGADLIPLMNQGSEGLKKYIEQARELGWTMGEETVKETAKADTQFKVLMALFRGLKIIITSSILPTLTAYIDKLIKYVKVNKELIKVRIVEFFKTLMGVMKVLLGILNGLWKTFSFLSRIVGGVDNAVRVLIGTFLIWQGLKIVSGLWLIVEAFIGLSGAIKGASVAMTIFNALISPITLGVLAIAGVIASLVLIVQDLYTYFTGGESVFGSSIDFLIEKFGLLALFIKSAKLGIDGLIWALNKIPGVKIGTSDMPLSEAVTSGANKLNISPSSTPVKKMVTSNSVSMNSPITVNVTGNSDPEQTAQATYSAVKDSIDQILREAYRATAPVAD